MLVNIYGGSFGDSKMLTTYRNTPNGSLMKIYLHGNNTKIFTSTIEKLNSFINYKFSTDPENTFLEFLSLTSTRGAKYNRGTFKLIDRNKLTKTWQKRKKINNRKQDTTSKVIDKATRTPPKQSVISGAPEW